MEIEKGSTRSHSVENSPSKTLWACRRTDKVMMINETRCSGFLWAGGLVTRILKGWQYTEVNSVIQNLAFSLLVDNRYVPDWTTGPKPNTAPSETQAISRIGAMYIMVTLYWRNLIIMWLFHFMYILYCVCFNLYCGGFKLFCNVCVCVCVCVCMGGFCIVWVSS
jgi:hypothetical protein